MMDLVCRGSKTFAGKLANKLKKRRKCSSFDDLADIYRQLPLTSQDLGLTDWCAVFALGREFQLEIVRQGLEQASDHNDYVLIWQVVCRLIELLMNDFVT